MMPKTRIRTPRCGSESRRTLRGGGGESSSSSSSSSRYSPQNRQRTVSGGTNSPQKGQGSRSSPLSPRGRRGGLGGEGGGAGSGVTSVGGPVSSRDKRGPDSPAELFGGGAGAPAADDPAGAWPGCASQAVPHRGHLTF